jgi:hypothetical protein
MQLAGPQLTQEQLLDRFETHTKGCRYGALVCLQPCFPPEHVFPPFTRLWMDYNDDFLIFADFHVASFSRAFKVVLRSTEDS